MLAMKWLLKTPCRVNGVLRTMEEEEIPRPWEFETSDPSPDLG
jgi:hypothetical protein